MKTKAILMTIAMMSAALAGCTGSDGVAEIDDETLQQLFDDNIQDFMNNTTVVVNNHYHNNTTVNNNDTTNVGGLGIGTGSNGSGGSMYLLDIQFSIADLIPGWSEIDYRNNTVDYWFEYYDYLTDESRTELFTIQCSDYYLIGSNSANGTSYSYWESQSNYVDAWRNLYNETISDLLVEAANSQFPEAPENSDGGSAGVSSRQPNSLIQVEYPVRTACDESYNSGEGLDDLLLFEIPIPEGVALKGASSASYALSEYVWAYDFEWEYNSSNYPCRWIANNIGEIGWEEQYVPMGCDNNGNSDSAFHVHFTFETMDWWFGEKWVGGDEDSILEVYVDNIVPGYEYRLVAYFTMSSVLAVE